MRGIDPRGAAGEGRAGAGPHVPVYNPVVFVGPAGAGKSRLVGDLFIRHCRQAGSGGPGQAAEAARLWDGRSLGREITAALASDSLHRLHARFVGARLAIVDGVEQISAWDAQRTLALLIDAATAAGATVVATLRMHPTACPGLEPSLASRLAGGLVVAVPAAATPAITPGPSGKPNAAPSLRRIMGLAARRHGLSIADLTGPSRRRSVALARAEAMYLARNLTGRTLEGIGVGFGGRDHTTVLHGIRVIERLRSGNPVLAAEIDRALEALGRRARSRRRVVG